MATDLTGVRAGSQGAGTGQGAGSQPRPTQPTTRRTRTLGRTGVLAALVLGVLVTIAVTVAIGPADIAPHEVITSILRHLGLGSLAGDPLPPLRDAMVWELRLPRVLVAGCVGAGLAVCGAIMQSLTRNPLADPYLLGLSSGASLGAVAVLILGIAVALPVAAFVGAVGALVASLALAGSLGRITPTRTVLAGLAVSQLCAAVTSFVIFWSSTGDSYREILSWLMGSVGSATWTSVAIAGGASLVISVPLMFLGNVLDAFTFGDDSARALGFNATRWRWGLLLAVALLTGALVSVSGSIGFVGLIIPHAVRGISGSGHRFLLPASALVGAIFLMWADTLARTVFSPRELPVGVVTAVIGAPIFAVILWRTRGGSDV